MSLSKCPIKTINILVTAAIKRRTQKKIDVKRDVKVCKKYDLRDQKAVDVNYSTLLSAYYHMLIM